MAAPAQRGCGKVQLRPSSSIQQCTGPLAIQSVFGSDAMTILEVLKAFALATGGSLATAGSLTLIRHVFFLH
jgi:hypothetical protein